MDTLTRRALEKEKKLQEQQLVESLESYQVVLEYLISEGYASSEESADKIILNMSEAWFTDIMELHGGKGHPGYKAGSKDHGDLEDHPAAGKKGGVLSPRYGHHLGDMDDEDEDEDDLESVVKQQSRDRRETVRKPLRDKVKAARKKMTKEELELDENRRAARSAGGYEDDSEDQPDPSKDGFTGIGKMTIKDIMALNKKIEARKKKIKEELVSEEDFSEGARDPEVEEKGKKVGEYERAGKYQGITSKFRKEYPGSREAKKEKGRKQTEGELEQERIKIRNARVAKHGFTSKEKRESKAREKYDSPRD